MKRFYFAAVVAFAMLLMSCIDDKSTISNGKAWITFDVAAEQIGTRVYGDGVAANDLEYAIYEKDKYDAPLIEDEIVGAFAGDVMQTSFSEKLAVGKSYVVLFWADAEQDPYTVDWNNQTIKITDPDALTAQNENLDAFFAKHEVKVTGPQTEPIELRRPFAQLNIGTADTAAAQAAGLMVKKSEVTVQAYTTLNLMNGSVDDAMELTYEMANIPSGENKTFTVKGKSYDNLSMNYLLVNTKELVTVKFTINDGTENVNTATYAQVPVERNYKTFIVGNLLTSAVNIDIIILPDWGKNDHIYDGNIIVEKSEVTSYKSGADETVEFTSKEAWTAQVVAGAMRADESDDSWCTVEPTSGEAGDAEITITTQPNDTGEDRTATVVITAGESTQEITVTQLATTKPAEEGDSPVPSNQIWYTTTDGNIVTPYKTDVFGAAITSNTYEDGKGVITFDGEVTAVGKDAFYRGTGATLETITLPKSVTEIGDYAFSYCSALKNISIYNGITKIGKSAFYSCQELTNIILPNSLIEIGENAFKSSGLTSITIPESVTIVGDTAFLSCENLSAFYGKGATEDNRCLVIDGVIKAFAPANYESDIYTIPYGATTVGYNAFSNLTILTEIIIPESVTTIDKYAFASNNGLLTVTLPKSITTIGMSAFQRCQNLATVYCKSATPSTLSSNVFFGNAEGLKIYVPASSVKAYKTANGWSEYADYIFADPSTEEDAE